MYIWYKEYSDLLKKIALRKVNLPESHLWNILINFSETLMYS